MFSDVSLDAFCVLEAIRLIEMNKRNAVTSLILALGIVEAGGCVAAVDGWKSFDDLSVQGGKDAEPDALSALNNDELDASSNGDSAKPLPVVFDGGAGAVVTATDASNQNATHDASALDVGDSASDDGNLVRRRSCLPKLMCGSVDCCDSLRVSGGEFPMGRSRDGRDACPTAQDPTYVCDAVESPEHTAIVNTFYMDRFEVSVGRFRSFVDAYSGPFAREGNGAHPRIPGGGWRSAWNQKLPSTRNELVQRLNCQPANVAWTDTPGAHENYPINCVDWYTAYAFCIWDGMRLPTEAEWEYAAAGGRENRMYPWGQEAPEATRANFICRECTQLTIFGVGRHSAGAGFWGHEDMAGGVWEWVFDSYEEGWYSGRGFACDNCANTEPNAGPDVQARVARGGGWGSKSYSRLRSAHRGGTPPDARTNDVGFRCATSEPPKN